MNQLHARRRFESERVLVFTTLVTSKPCREMKEDGTTIELILGIIGAVIGY